MPLPKGFTLETQQVSNLPPSFVLEAPEVKTLQWSDVPGVALRSAPSSAGHLIKNIYEAVTSPVQTLKSGLDIGFGALQNMFPESVVNFINKSETPETLAALQRARETASAAGQMLGQRYGGSEQLKTTLAKDPVGAMSDLAAVLSGGGTLAAKIPGFVGRTGAVVAQAGSTIDPLVLALKGIGKTAQTGMDLVPKIVGLQAGVGGQALTEATKAGRTGGQVMTDFVQNLSGSSKMTDVLEAAKQNLQQIRINKNADYVANKANYAGDATVLKFNDIDAALTKALDSVQVQSPTGVKKFTLGSDELKKIEELKNVVNEWKIEPSLHTVDGLDALKQRVGSIYTDNPKQKNVDRLTTEVYNAVKQTIEQQAPGYAKTMKEYSDASELIKEIERALSLNNRASADTSMRKLQSLMRNNVNTNYGYRTSLAEELEKAGGSSLMPSLAGQALGNWTPRGLQSATALPTAGGAFFLGGPLGAAVSLATSSPRLMGETALKIGQTQRLAELLANKLPNSPISAMEATRIAQQLQRWQQNGEQQ